MGHLPILKPREVIALLEALGFLKSDNAAHISSFVVLMVARVGWGEGRTPTFRGAGQICILAVSPHNKAYMGHEISASKNLWWHLLDRKSVV